MLELGSEYARGVYQPVRHTLHVTSRAAVFAYVTYRGVSQGDREVSHGGFVFCKIIKHEQSFFCVATVFGCK